MNKPNLNLVLLTPYRGFLDKQIKLELEPRDITLSYRINIEMAKNPWLTVNLFKLCLNKLAIIPQWIKYPTQVGVVNAVRIWGDREDIALFVSRYALLKAYIDTFTKVVDEGIIHGRKMALTRAFELIQKDEKVNYYMGLVDDTKISSRLTSVYKFILEFGKPLKKRNTDGSSYLHYTYLGPTFRENKLIIFTRILP